MSACAGSLRGRPVGMVRVAVDVEAAEAAASAARPARAGSRRRGTATGAGSHAVRARVPGRPIGRGLPDQHLARPSPPPRAAPAAPRRPARGRCAGASAFGFRKSWWLGSFQIENQSTFGQPLEVARVALADRGREARELARVGLEVAGRGPERRPSAVAQRGASGASVEQHPEALVGGAPHEVVVGAEARDSRAGSVASKRGRCASSGRRRDLVPLHAQPQRVGARGRACSRSVCSRRRSRRSGSAPCGPR